MAQLVVRGRLYFDLRSGFLLLIVLIAAQILFRADVGPSAAAAADGLLKQFSYYAAIALLAYNAVRLGDLTRDQLVNAILIGVLGTALIKIGISGFSPPPHGAEGAAQLYLGRSIAYLLVMGFGLTFARWLIAGAEGRQRHADLALAAFFLVMIGTSLVRGPWLATMLAVVVITWMLGRRSYLMLVPLALVLVLTVPVARERLVNADIAGGAGITSGRATLWSDVWDQFIVPGLPNGHGFGFSWSLTPQAIGISGFQLPGSTTSLVYLHNDFLFWIMEFGFWGVGLWIAYWLSLVRSVSWLRRGSPSDVVTAITLVSVLVVFLVEQLVANGFVEQATSERFFVTAGFLFGTRALARTGQVGEAMRVREAGAPPTH